ncbi:MAG: HAMP domain-containing histidine kinase [Crocinitomicaceae bacterium]|nr:HAMP domain-containing histidine kinase [Crocinitomicaceae bacterium]
MFRRKLKNPVFLFYILVVYLIVQCSWWLYLIHSLYQKTYDPAILEKKTWMLLGEGIVFLFILLGIAFMIRKSLRKERAVNELQQNFLQSVSHELKTPLASVGLFLETLKKRELTEEKRSEIYDKSLTEVKRLNHLISDILTARNIESQNYFIHKVDVQLDEYLKDKIHILNQTLMKDFQVNLETEKITASLDKEALDSIIYNLIENACKYSPKGSAIDIRLFKSGDHAILQVSDQGIGLDAIAKERVFQKFYRVENESTRKSKGTGLGLYITKFLVEKQNGKILLKDNTPQGLTVEIQF